MKKILSLCLIIGIALVTLTGCVGNQNTDVSNDQNQAFWQELVDRYCVDNYGEDWYGEITNIDQDECGYVSFDPVSPKNNAFGGGIMALKSYLISKYANQTNE